MKSQFPQEIRDRLERTRVVAVLILNDAADAVPLAKALLAGGVEAMELTLRTPAAMEGLAQIRRSVPEMLVGIGTVLTTSQVGEVASAGAHFAVSPGFNPDVVRRAQNIGLPFAPGVMTPSDIEAAIQLDCRELKFFPAGPTGGIPMLTSLRAPYAHLGVQFMPLGGVNADNMADWLRCPGVFAIGGSWLAPAKLIQAQDWGAIQQRSAEARQIAASIDAT